MPKNLNSVDSKKARKRRRGETDEAYAKRIARLDSQRACRERSKQRKAAMPPESSAIDTGGSNVLERFLGEQAKQRQQADAQIASLVKQLERERAERAALEASLSARKLVGCVPGRVGVDIRPKGHEIIDLCDNTQPEEFVHEIIEDFRETKHAPENDHRIETKPPESQDVFQVVALPESDPAYITLKGYICRAVNGAADVGDFSSSEHASEEKNSQPASLPTLGEAAEMLLWLGWVERARQGFPSKMLVARFGEVEQSMWRDAISVASMGDDVRFDAALESIPFAPALTRTLSEALQAFPPATDLDRVVARCLVGVPRQRLRPKLSCFEGVDNCANLWAAFGRVRRELEAGSLVIRREP